MFSIKTTILVGLPVMLIVLLSATAYWLLNTSSGAAWLWNRLEAQAAIDVRSSQVSGDLASGFVVQDLAYRSAGLDLLVQRTEIEAGIGWWPLSIRFARLTLQDVDILVRSSENPVETTNAGEGIRAALAGLELPVPLAIDDAVLTRVTLQQNEEPAFSLFESVHFRAALDKRLVVDHLEIQAADFETSLQGYLELAPPFELSVTSEGRYAGSGASGETVMELPFNLVSSGDLDKLRVNISSHKYGLQMDGEILDPVDRPAWDIKASMDQISWPETDAAQGLVLSGLSLVSQGSIDDWSFALESAVQMDVLRDARIAVSGSGTTSAIDIHHAVLTGPGIDLELSGKLDWPIQTVAGFKAVIRQLDLSPWINGWPVGEMLAGELELNWSGSGLQIPASQLTVAGTGLKVGIEADIDIETNRVVARLDWSSLSWPLKDPTAGFFSESGQMNISGSADDWAANGGLDVKVGDYPQGRFDIQGGGNLTSMHLLIPAGEILGGTLSGEAGADWSQDLNWNAAIQVIGIDPEPLLPGWPGRLDSVLEVSAQGEPQQIQINIEALEGQLRGVAVTARGGLDVAEDKLAFRTLEVRTDAAVLELNGVMADPAGATVKFAGDLPSGLLDGASGKLELEGRYSSAASRPLLEFQLKALDLAWNELTIGHLAAGTPGAEPGGSIPALQLDASDLAWEDSRLDELSLTLSPVGEGHELRASMVSDELVLNSVMSLKPENRNDPLNGPWQGLLAGLEVAIGPAYSFKLSEPAAFAWSSGSAVLGPLCLSENVGASLCLKLDYQNNGDWSVVADATAIPVDYLRDILELDVHLEQLIDGHMEWRQPHDGAPTGGADFRITAGRILDLLDNELLAETNEGRFAFTLQNGNLESGVLDIEFPGTGFIDIDFNVLDIVRDGRQEIQGRALVRLDHIGLVGQLLMPELDAVDGQFESSIQLGGSVADPDFNGAFKFSNGLIQYAPIGLHLEEIEFGGRVRKRDRGHFRGQFRAGDGVASFGGRFLFEELKSMQLEVSLSGDKLLLVNTDTLKILTDTDLKIEFSPERMDINGRITIPSARLTPDNLLLGEVTDSEDLVIETPGIEAQTEIAETPQKNRVYGQLEVAFGDDVLIKVPDIETTISGSTLYKWNGEPVPLAQGAYILKGTVDIYGPTLAINKGTISFSGGPADNPVLNIRAGRDIYGNTQIRRAGVQVIGTLKRPVLEAYTVPITSESRAWTLLVTGTDFDQGQGVSGFDLGTYIAPKLYVSYGISLFENENVLSARYDLKKGFGVKVTSGQRETGLDVSYTIDR
jgi:translocation and assembly module TamB